MIRREEAATLTGIRGIAALLVVLHHARMTLGDATAEALSFLQEGRMAVDVFFLLSGWVMAHVYSDRMNAETGIGPTATSFIIARIARTYPTHVFALVTLALFETLRPFVGLGGPPVGGNERFAPWALVSHVLMLNGLGVHPGLSWNFPSWSISAEFIAYLSFPLLALLSFGAKPKKLVAGTIVLLCADAALLHLHHLGMAEMVFDLGLPRALIGFSAGVFLREIHENKAFRPSANLAEAIVWLAFVTFAAGLAVGPGLHPALLLIPAAMLIHAAPFVTGIAGKTLSCSSIQWLGRISYSLYITHAIILHAWEQWAALRPSVSLIDSTTGLAILFLAILPCCLLVGQLTHSLVEKPMRERILANIRR
jgi:peptidoglycan/LPS O-acetylase OafA/YrhL